MHVVQLIKDAGSLQGKLYFQKQGFGNRFVRGTVGAHKVFMVQPDQGGRNHMHAFDSIKKSIKNISKTDPIDYVIGFGTAGAEAGEYVPGDVVLYSSVVYLPKKDITTKLPGPWRRIASKLPVSLERLIKVKLLPVPYNPNPTFYRSRQCVTTSYFVSGDSRKKVSPATECFQMNDYVTARAAQESGINFFAVRVISDVEKHPKSFVLVNSALNTWRELAYKKKRPKTGLDSHYYSSFRSLYLSNGRVVLEKILKGLK
jgi:nucleoside phosphorylase